MAITVRKADQIRPSRSRTAFVLFVLLGLVQLFVSAVVPFADARAPSKLGAHIEQPTERHYVHDDANCSACIARHLTGTAPLPAAPPTVAPAFVPQPPESMRLVPESERRDPVVARAPPAPRPLG